MFIELLTPIWYPGNTLPEEVRRKEFSSNGTDIKVGAIGRVFCNGMPSHASKRRQRHSLTPLNLLWWASLVVGVRAQMVDPFPAQFNLSSLNGFNGFSLSGEQESDWSGNSVSMTGDVNQDGVTDILIGAYGASPSGRMNAGKTYVLFGKKNLGSGGNIDLSSLNGTNGFVLNGERDDDHFGVSVTIAGDVNVDGVEDILIGAYFASPASKFKAGKSYVIFGKEGLGSVGSMDLSNLNGTNGFVMNGAQAGDWSGFSVSSAGDVNKDGVTDLLIGANNASPSGRSNAGKTYVVFGKSGLGSGGSLELSSLNGQNGFVINGEQGNDESGFSVSSGGDVNSDGVADILIGAYRASPSGKLQAGKTYVVFGKVGIGSGGSLELSSINGTNGFILFGVQMGDYSGSSVSSGGDLNGDGITDILIGAPTAVLTKASAGKMYVIYGSTELSSRGNIELSRLNGSDGFVLNGDQGNDFCGISVSKAGDVNGDGIIDLAVGAIQISPNSRKSHGKGKTYIVYGKPGLGSGGSLELSRLDGTDGLVLNGEQKGDLAGYSLSYGGDVNRDGITDFIIGAYSADPFGRTEAGKSYVVFGRKLTENQTTNTLSKNTISSLTFVPPLLSKVSHTSGHSLTSFPTNSQHHKSTLQTSDESVGNGLIYGIAGAVSALVCSALAGGVVAWRQVHKSKHDSGDEVEGMGMTSIGPNSTVYGKFPSLEKDPTEYTKPPPPQSHPAEYNHVGALLTANEYDKVESPSENPNYESVFSPLE